MSSPVSQLVKPWGAYRLPPCNKSQECTWRHAASRSACAGTQAPGWKPATATMSYARGDVIWVEVEGKPGWWPARVHRVPPRVPEGQLAVSLFGSDERKEVEADSQCMAFDEPVVGENLLAIKPSEFGKDKALHAKFKEAIAEAQACRAGEGAALSLFPGMSSSRRPWPRAAPPWPRAAPPRNGARMTSMLCGRSS